MWPGGQYTWEQCSGNISVRFGKWAHNYGIMKNSYNLVTVFLPFLGINS